MNMPAFLYFSHRRDRNCHECNEPLVATEQRPAFSHVVDQENGAPVRHPGAPIPLPTDADFVFVCGNCHQPATFRVGDDGELMLFPAVLGATLPITLVASTPSR